MRNVVISLQRLELPRSSAESIGGLKVAFGFGTLLAVLSELILDRQIRCA